LGLRLTIPVSFIEIRVLVHATEDTGKVLEALQNILGEEVSKEVEFIQEKLEGHYSNPITLVKAKVYSKSQARKILQNIFSKLEELDRQKLWNEVEEKVDEDGNFYLRFDKQEAYLGRFKLTNADPVRIQVKLAIPRKQKDKIVEVFKQLILPTNQK